jgi:hypothetical protein
MPDMPYYTMATNTQTGQRAAVPATQQQFNQYEQDWQNTSAPGGGMARMALMANPVFRNQAQITANQPDYVKNWLAGGRPSTSSG